MAGRLEVIGGPMFSGKSEELIRQLVRHDIAKRRVIAFKPQIDDRYEIEYIKSHSGHQFPCVPLEQAADTFGLVSLYAADPNKHYDVVGFDEAQFFGEDIIETVRILVERDGKTVVVAGLDKTYRKEPFGYMPELLALADSVTKLSAICNICGNDATLTQRLLDGKPAPFSGETVVVGGLDSYEARCRSCFEIG